MTRWSRRYHREVVGIVINTRGFAVDTDELAAKKKALQDASDVLLAAEGPQAAGRNRISWRGLLAKKTNGVRAEQSPAEMAASGLHAR